MSELLPCPFCGGNNTLLADTGTHWVICNACCAEGPVEDSEQEAVAKWNARTAIPASAQQPSTVDPEYVKFAEERIALQGQMLTQLRRDMRWIAERRWNEDADLDDICTRADCALAVPTTLPEGKRGTIDLDADMAEHRFYRDAMIEECAQHLQTSYPDHAWLNAVCAALRSLKTPSQHPSTKSRSPSSDQGDAA